MKTIAALQQKLTRRRTALLLVFFFFAFYFIMGLCLANGNAKVYGYNDALFGTDNQRVLLDLTSLDGGSGKAREHPLFLLLCQPFTLLVKGFARNPVVAVLLSESIAAAASVAFVFAALLIIGNGLPSALLLSGILGFSFSYMMFGTIPETFIYAAFFLSLFWYYLFHLIYEKEKLDKKDYFLLIFFGATSMGITITNYCVYALGLLLLLIKKYRAAKKIALQFFIITIIVIVSVALAAGFQKLVWDNVAVFWWEVIKGERPGNPRYMDFSLSVGKLRTELLQTVVYAFFSPGTMAMTQANPDGDVTGGFIRFANGTPHIALSVALLSVIALFALYNVLKFKKKVDATTLGFTALAALFNLGLHYFFDYREAFLFTPHFLFLLILLVGISVATVENSRLKKIELAALGIFLLCQIVNNVYRYCQLTRLVGNHFGENPAPLVKIIATGGGFVVFVGIAAAFCKRYVFADGKLLNVKDKRDYAVLYMIFTLAACIFIKIS